MKSGSGKVKPSPSLMKAKKKLKLKRNQNQKRKLSLEDYLDFISSPEQSRLTFHSLNQIISIHGFKKLEVPKRELSDVLKTLDLTDLSRSTLKSNISASAELTKEEISADLNRLEWQECCITSVQTLNSLPEQQPPFKPKTKARSKRKRSVRAAAADSISSAVVSFQSS